MNLSIVVAMSENRVIGRSGVLPWRLPEDLRRFRRLTEGHAVIMGRKTFESIGRLLPKRDNIILSRREGYQVPGAHVSATLPDALEHVKDRDDEVFIIGGGDIYRQALPRVDRLHLTLVHQQVEGDTFFPAIPADFVERRRERFQEPIPHSFVMLERTSK